MPQKLSDSKVVAIKKEYAKGKLSQRALADKYGLTPSYLNKLLTGKARPNAR